MLNLQGYGVSLLSGMVLTVEAALLSLVVAILLILTYRSPLLWLVPLTAVGVAAIMSMGVVYALTQIFDFTVTSMSSALLIVLVILVIAVGGLVEIVPLSFQKSVTEPVAGLKPYTPLQLAGRDDRLDDRPARGARRRAHRAAAGAIGAARGESSGSSGGMRNTTRVPLSSAVFNEASTSATSAVQTYAITACPSISP